MNAMAVPFWGQMSACAETSTNTKIAVGTNSNFDEESHQASKQIVFVVAAHVEAGYGNPTRLRYRASGLPPMSQVFLMEAPASFSRFASGETFTLSEINSTAWRGFLPFQASRRVLFTETLELRVSKLRRLSPRISLGRQTLDDDDA